VIDILTNNLLNEERLVLTLHEMLEFVGGSLLEHLSVGLSSAAPRLSARQQAVPLQKYDTKAFLISQVLAVITR
jgi:hypothetical protein